MSEKTIAGILGALGLVVVVVGGVLFIGGLIPEDRPAIGPSSYLVPEEESDEPPPDEVDPEPSPPDRGEVGPRVIDPSLDDTDYFEVTYEELRDALARRDFAELARLIGLAKGHVDGRIVGELVALLEQPSFAFRVAGLLGRIKTEGTLDAVHEFLLRTQSVHGRRAAILAMTEAGTVAVPRLLGLMQGSQDKALIALTATALGRIGSVDAVRGILQTLATGAWPDLHGTLEEALGQVKSAEAVRVIAAALAESTDLKIQGSLIVALGKGGSPAALEPLAALARKGENVDLSAKAVASLGMLGTADAGAIVLEIAKTEGPQMRAARYALRHLRDRAMVPHLVATLEETKDEDLRKSVLVAMGRLGDRETTPRLVTALEEESSVDTRIAAAQALGDMKDPAATASLGRTVRDTEAHVNLRVQAARAMAKIADPKAIPELQKALEQEGTPDNVKAIIRLSINQIRMRRPVEPRRVEDGSGGGGNVPRRR